MATAGTVTIKLDGDAATLVRELNKANQATKSWANDVRATVNDVGEKFALMTAAVATGLGAMILNQGKSIDSFGDLAKRIGIGTEALSSFNLAAKLNGVTQEEMGKALVGQQKFIEAAAKGTGEQAERLAQLGLSARDLIALKPEEQFYKLADAIKDLPTHTQQLAAETEIFKDRAGALMPVIEEGSVGLRKMAEDARALGLTLSEVDVAKVQSAFDALDMAKGVVEGAFNKIAIAAAPILQAVAEEFIEVGKSATITGDDIFEAFRTAGEVIGVFADGLHVVKIAAEAAGAAALFAAAGFIAVIDRDRSDAWFKKSEELYASFKADLMAPLPSTAIEQWLDRVDARRANFEATFDPNKFKPGSAAEIDASLSGGAGGAFQLPAPNTDAIGEAAKARMDAETQRQVDRDLAEALRHEQILADADAFERQRTRIEEDAALKRNGIYQSSALVFGKTWTDSHKKALTSAMSFSGSVMSIANSLFGENKKVAIATTIINTLRMAVAAGAETPGPWYIKAAAVAASLAMGFAQVSQIQSTSVGSSGGGGGGVSGGSLGGGITPTTQPLDAPSRNNQVTININGDVNGWDDYIQSKIISGIQEAVDGKDLVLIGGGSRQGQIIREGG